MASSQIVVDGRHTGRVFDGLDEGLGRGGLSFAFDLAVVVGNVENSGGKDLVLLTLQGTSHSGLKKMQ